MPKMPRPRRAVWLAALAAVGPAASASLANFLLPRDTCAANFTKCSQAGLPDFFCCPSGQTCNVLAANTTVLCCPSGADCSTIQPISCDITQQDGQKNPSAVIKTTLLDGIMLHCGDGTCCPFGYLCNASNQCSKNPNQNALPFTTTPSSSTTTASGVTSTTTSSPSNSASSATNPQGASTSAASASASASSEAASGDNGPQPAVIAGAAVGAAIVGLFAAFVVWRCIKSRLAKKRADEDNLKSIRSTSSFGNIISNPIISEATTMRSDFARRSPGARTSTASSFATRINEDLGRIGGGDFGSSFGGTRKSPPTTPTRAPRPMSRESARVAPIRNMRQSSIAYGYGAPNTSPYNNGSNLHAHNPYAESVYPQESTMPYPKTHKPREPSSMSIPLFADARTLGRPAGGGSGGHLEPPGRRYSRDTTCTNFTDVIKQAALDDVVKGKEPFVPPEAYSPASRRR